MQRGRRRVDRAQIIVKRYCGALTVLLRDARVGLADIVGGDRNIVGGGLLDFERLVDQVAQHLQAQPRALGIRNLAAIGRDDQRHALVHVGAGDDRAVDHRRGAPDIGILAAEQGQPVGQIEPDSGERLLLHGLCGQRRGSDHAEGRAHAE